MSEEMDDIKRWTLYILDCLSDIEFQKEAWIEKKHLAIVHDLETTVNSLEEFYFFDHVAQGFFKVTKEEQQKMEQFVKDVTDFDPVITDYNALFTNEKWIAITHEAAEIKTILERINWE